MMEKMMLNYHLKLQEMCDCYMETDFAAVMRGMSERESKDLEEDAIKYLALAIMYAITQKAEKLSLQKKGEESKVSIKNNEKEKLPVPSGAVVDKAFAIMRSILHVTEDKGEVEFSLGLRSGEVNVKVKFDRDKDKESLKIKFPQ
jgi:hypothetical protein